MVTDDERREVARRLRENAEAHPDMSLILNLAFADDSLKPDGAMEWKVTPHDAAMRLADLIEPDHVGDSNKMVDRDALLALADEIEDNDVTYCVSAQYVLNSYAGRIRKALGVEP